MSVWPETSVTVCVPVCTVTSPIVHTVQTTCVPVGPEMRKPSVPRTAICEVGVENL